MELELSLRVSSSLKPFVDVDQKSTSKVPHVSCSYMGLSLPAKSTHDEVEVEYIEKHLSPETSTDKTASLFSSDLPKYGGNVGNKRSLDDHGDKVVEGERGSNSKAASDEDENGLTRKKLRLSKQQSAFLENSFKEHSSTLNPVSNINTAYLAYLGKSFIKSQSCCTIRHMFSKQNALSILRT